MRKLILLAAMAAVALPTAATAQRHDSRHRTEVRQDRREVRQDRHELRRDQRELRHDRRAVRHTRYVAPYRSWSYRPVTVGHQLRPVFYSPRYYISDYGAYQLQAPRHHWLRWIRYGDDLLLVNIRNGRVLDVVHYRFW
jgi:Ni/Co efflux regulator RcnB